MANPLETRQIARDTFMRVPGTRMWRKLYGPEELKPVEEAALEWHAKYLGGEWLPDSPARTAKKRRPRLIAWVNESCTGCENCIPFCPVDCIEHTPAPIYPDDHSPTRTIMIRYEECIGCELCAKACDSANAGYNAIYMVPTDSFEEEFGVRVSDDLRRHPAGWYFPAYKEVAERMLRERSAPAD